MALVRLGPSPGHPNRYLNRLIGGVIAALGWTAERGEDAGG